MLRLLSEENKSRFYSVVMRRGGKISINTGIVSYDRVLVKEVATTR